MKLDNIAIRQYKTGDEANIIRLYLDVFGHQKPLSLWNWQYKDNPQGPAWISIAEVGSEIVAFYGIMRNYLNFSGKKIISGTPTDSMVRADYRGKGLYINIASNAYNTTAQTGAKAIFGFPNRSSYPGFMRDLYGHKIANLKYYFHFMGISNSIWSSKFRMIQKYKNRIYYIALLKFYSKNLQIAISSRLPYGMENFLKKINDFEVLSIYKDVSYFNWRYKNHPKNKYEFHTLYNENRPIALIVCIEKGNVIKICELLHETKSISETVLFLRHTLLYYYYKSNAQKIEFFGIDDGFFDTVFSLSGFRSVSASNLVLVGRVFNDERLEKKFLFPHNWTISLGDTDLV